MAAPMNVPIVPGLTISGGYIVRITALDPTTGNLVPNVKISLSAILATNLTAQPTPALAAGPFVLVPGPGA